MFNLRGRKWEKDGKVNYFTNLEAWKIDSTSANNAHVENAPSPGEDDMPF